MYCWLVDCGFCVGFWIGWVVFYLYVVGDGVDVLLFICILYQCKVVDVVVGEFVVEVKVVGCLYLGQVMVDQYLW